MEAQTNPLDKGILNGGLHFIQYLLNECAPECEALTQEQVDRISKIMRENDLNRGIWLPEVRSRGK